MTGLLVCALIAVATVQVYRTLWYLGDVYWWTLAALGLLQLAVSGVCLVRGPRSWWHTLGLVVLFIVGQWWVLEMAAMLLIWRLRGFAP
ncbi:hypothetical protein [Rugamonas violacea]|nr:hypothetical protein [Rugamonas sp. CCM 8940]